MSGVTVDHQQKLPAGIRDKLTQFQRRVRFVKVAEGALGGLFGLAVSYLLVFILDRFIDTPVSARLAILLGGATGFGIFFPFMLHRWVWGSRPTRSSRQTAADTLSASRRPATWNRRTRSQRYGANPQRHARASRDVSGRSGNPRS